MKGINNTTLAIIGGGIVFIGVLFILFIDEGLPDTKPIDLNITDNTENYVASDTPATNQVTEEESEVVEEVKQEEVEEVEEVVDEVEDLIGFEAPVTQIETTPEAPIAPAVEDADSAAADEVVTPAANDSEEATTTEEVTENEEEATTTEEVVVEPEPEPAGDPTLLGYWNFDEGDGSTFADASGNGNTGTIVTSGSLPLWVEGQIDGGLETDGSGDYLQIPHSDSLNIGAVDQSYSVSLWVFVDADPSAERRIIGKGGRSGEVPFTLRIDDEGVVIFRMTDVFNAVEVRTKQEVSGTGKWHHLVAVRDVTSDVIRLYKDGTQVDFKVDSTTKSMENTSPITFDRYEISPNTYQFHKMGIDDLHIYGKVLSASEINDIYQTNR